MDGAIGLDTLVDLKGSLKFKPNMLHQFGFPSNFNRSVDIGVNLGCNAYKPCVKKVHPGSAARALAGATARSLAGKFVGKGIASKLDTAKLDEAKKKAEAEKKRLEAEAKRKAEETKQKLAQEAQRKAQEQKEKAKEAIEEKAGDLKNKLRGLF